MPKSFILKDEKKNLEKVAKVVIVGKFINVITRVNIIEKIMLENICFEVSYSRPDINFNYYTVKII